MPQGPLPATVAVQPVSGNYAGRPLQLDAVGTLLTGEGASTHLNVTAATVIKAAAGRACRVSVVVAGSTTGAIYDHATTSGVAAANQIYTINDVIGSYQIDIPCAVGIVVVPGTGMTVAISYS